jgi:DNA-directed RNA polymerase subunit M
MSRLRRKTAVKRRIPRTKKRRVVAAEREPKKQTAVIEYCDKCSAILIPVKKGKSTYLKCRRCGTEKKRKVKSLKIVEEPRKNNVVAVLERDTTPLPMVEMKCEKCGHTHSYFWLQQTRTADEPPTQFFRCVKCKYTWREYK